MCVNKKCNCVQVYLISQGYPSRFDLAEAYFLCLQKFESDEAFHSERLLDTSIQNNQLFLRF